MINEEHGMHSPGDVRMRGFASRTSLGNVLNWLDGAVPIRETAYVSLECAAGRILAHDVYSSVNVPGFRRAMMDGFAVYAADTLGATPYAPLTLQVVGTSLPGHPFPGNLVHGQCVEVMTGAAIPCGSDAVLPFEFTDQPIQHAGSERYLVKVIDHVSPLKNIGLPGEDVSKGDKVLSANRRIRPQDVGILSSIGVSEVAVVRTPLVHLVVTGNELLPAGSVPRDYAIVDANGPMIRTLIHRDGGRITDASDRIIPDDPSELRAALLTPCDILIVSGGSSVGREDFAPEMVRNLGELVIHGVAMRPSSPTGIGVIGSKVVFLLPGNPVSCLCAYDFFAGRFIRAVAGLARDWPYRKVVLPLLRKLVSVIGRVDYARVTIERDGVMPMAVSGASILSSTTRADGFIIVPECSEGAPAGANVEVYLYD